MGSAGPVFRARGTTVGRYHPVAPVGGARSKGIATVRIAQNLPLYLDAFGRDGQHKVGAPPDIGGNAQHWVCAAVSTASAERIDAVHDSRLRAAQEAPDGHNPERPQAGS